MKIFFIADTSVTRRISLLTKIKHIFSTPAPTVPLILLGVGREMCTFSADVRKSSICTTGGKTWTIHISCKLPAEPKAKCIIYYCKNIVLEHKHTPTHTNGVKTKKVHTTVAFRPAKARHTRR